MNANSSALISAWDALPGDPAIANFGQPIMLRGTKVLLSEFQAYTEDEKLEALNNLIGSKHCLVLAPSDCGSFVPVSQMDTDKLIFSAKFKARNETSAIIDDEIMPVFDELVTLLEDVDPAVSAQALEDVQDMIFDQTLRKLSKGHLKFFYFYLDDLMECLVMIVGNRKVLSFDTKKLRAFQQKNQPILDVAPNKPKAPRAKKAAKPEARKSSSESSSESESDSSSSSSTSSSEDGLVPDGQVTPVFPAKPSTPTLIGISAASLPAASLSAAQVHARDTLAAQKILLEAQQRVAALAAIGLSFQSQPANQASGSPFKAPPVTNVVVPPLVASLQPSYHTPKKSALDKIPRKSSSKHSRGSKSSKRSSKKSKKSRRHSKRAKHAKKPKKQSSESSSSSPESTSKSESDSPPQKKDAANQVLCSVCYKNTAHLAFVNV